jgi:thiamine biosynthesis protein ThiS|tara:strand:- start:367 stop:585 length:219 start_codon:yes stop_codon:yes gene_type:complete
MKKLKKIKIKVNGKIKTIIDKSTLYELINDLKIPIIKVAIELNKEIISKKEIKKIKLENDDVIEIVHFIGGG